MKKLNVVHLFACALASLTFSSAVMAANKTSIDQYIERVPTFGVREEVVETGWYKISGQNKWNEFGDPTKRVEKAALQAIKVKLKAEDKKQIDTTVTYHKIDKCEATRDYQKYYFKQVDSSSASSSSYIITNDFIAGVGRSYSSYYSYEKSIRETYCAEDATYLKATVKMTTRLATSDAELKQYYVLQHMKSTTTELTAVIRELLAGLNEIEKNPVITKSRYGKFGIKSGMEMSAWMNFYFSRVRMSLAYADFVKSLNLGFESASMIDGLRQQAVGALRKLNQFESPAIYVVQLDDEDGNRPSISPLFDLSDAKDLASTHKITLSADPALMINNRSKVMEKSFLPKLALAARCQSQFEALKAKASAADVLYGRSKFIEEAHFLLRSCNNSFYVNDVKESERDVVYHGSTSYDTAARLAENMKSEVESKMGVLAKTCVPFQVEINKGEGDHNGYQGAFATVRLKFLCPRPTPLQ